ncbi:MAG: short chain dehydrogenase [Lautropia sp.]|nr:MAG: SDR family oxidoreductase [Pseudomonadota bacterium]MBC6958395.1 short chain dehydrogenase [Lautropia sp.]MCL4701360.1 SDR family oxidoreductase [Burkholderiaceae bacterium]MCZ2413247.1 SDR family oxidoreductase [Burkholderiales bacterium]MDL1909015.1 SDR family oxidoreductase [Betaproteobacteria bacterium PRO1]
MQFVILTGASKGLGAAMAERLLSASRHLVCVARSPNEALAAQARASGAPLDYRQCDLSDAAAAARLADSLGQALRAASGVSRFVLINNAGTIEPIGRVESLQDAPLARALQLNLAAPMLLTAAFLAATAASGVERRVLNISTGAARYPVAGWSAYCSAKAALDMFTRCIVAEQAGRPNAVRACSLAPGVVDTGMQATIRAADPAGFPSVERFRRLKAERALGAPGEVAARILAYLERDDFGAREIDDIREVAG